MNKYTIYCTETQTRKALELGAPIESQGYIQIKGCELPNDWYADGDQCYHIPTAEQMIGWLRKQKVFVHIDPCFDICCNWYISSKGYNKYGYSSDIKVCKSPEEATFAAIDSALDYLIQNKK